MTGAVKVKCGICDQNIPKTKSKLLCGTCKRYFHPDCVGVAEEELRNIGRSRIWACGKCKHSRSEVRKSQGPTQNNFDGQLPIVGRRTSFGGMASGLNAPSENQLFQDNNQQILTEIQNMRKDFREFQESLGFLNQLLETEREKNERMMAEINIIKGENKFLRQELQYVQKFVERQETQQIQNNVVIYGLCSDTDEDETAKNKAMKVLTFIDNNLTAREIKSFKLIKSKENQAAVQVSFEDTKRKSDILRCRYQKGKISGEMCDIPNVRDIYINEEMTAKTYKLLKESYKLKGYGYKYVWQRGGLVYARLTENGNVVKINTIDQIAEMIENSR